MPETTSDDLIGDLLVLIELTELAARVPNGARERWALDCARRALGVDLSALAPHVTGLRRCLSVARAHLRQPTDEGHAFDDALAIARDHLELLRDAADGSLHGQRALAAIEATVFALTCVSGESNHELAARHAQLAFEDLREEATAQARRLLLRTRLIPTGAELLVRLDLAEARGLLPGEPTERAWLDAHRSLLMAEDEDGRLAVVLRYLERVFLAELERAG